MMGDMTDIMPKIDIKDKATDFTLIAGDKSFNLRAESSGVRE